MADRVSEIVLLCEDDPQEQIVRRYLERARVRTSPPTFRPRNASREAAGGNVGWVLKEFPKERDACRRRHAAYANTRLIVVIDADDHTVDERRRQLDVREGDDPVVVLIPKRHIETWIQSAMGHAVNETDSYKHPTPDKHDIRAAGNRIYDWAHQSPEAGATCVDSLRRALPQFRRLG